MAQPKPNLCMCLVYQRARAWPNRGPTLGLSKRVGANPFQHSKHGIQLHCRVRQPRGLYGRQNLYGRDQQGTAESRQQPCAGATWHAEKAEQQGQSVASEKQEREG